MLIASLHLKLNEVRLSTTKCICLLIAINTKHIFWIKELQYKDIPMNQMIAKFDNRPGFGK